MLAQELIFPLTEQNMKIPVCLIPQNMRRVLGAEWLSAGWQLLPLILRTLPCLAPCSVGDLPSSFVRPLRLHDCWAVCEGINQSTATSHYRI
jgi:hypothetical protein